MQHFFMYFLYTVKPIIGIHNIFNDLHVIQFRENQFGYFSLWQTKIYDSGLLI